MIHYVCDARWHPHWKTKFECPRCRFVAKRRQHTTPICPACRVPMVDRGFAWRPEKKAKRPVTG